MEERKAPADALSSLGSSWRCRPAADTVDAATAWAARLGISRVADITRMDRLGLPVYASVRPRGAALCVHAGKGLRPEEAHAGALMEAIEFAVAEPQASCWQPCRIRLGELAAQFGDGLCLADFAPRFGVRLDPAATVPAVACDDIANGRAVLLPAELVFAPYVPAPDERVFGWSTNGLASGNTLDEATLHGVLEVLERDALAMNRPCDGSHWVAPGGLPAPLGDLAAHWQTLGIRLAVRHIPNALSLPCFEATLHEPQSDDVNIASGSGLHLDAAIAVTRAVCEAAQSRLSHIHGGRDDITAFYAKYADVHATARRQREQRLLAKVFDTGRPIAWGQIPSAPQPKGSAGDVLGALIERLGAAGFKTVVRHTFALDLGGLSVVRIVVPRCEDAESADRVGTRLAERIAAHG